MTKQEIEQKLKEIFQLVVKKTDAETGDISGASNLRTDLGLTSIGMLYLVIAIEEFFSIRFDDVNYNDFTTVSDVVDYIAAQQQ